MARQKKYPEEMVARFSAGTFDQIKTVIHPTEDRTDFIRDAVEREIQRRRREAGVSGQQ